MVYLSICLSCHQFLLSAFYSFPSKSFTSLDRFIPEYFILFGAMVSGIVSLLSFSDCLLHVYKNATDFCILILYPAALMNFLMSSCTFLVASLGFSMYSITSSANSDSFSFSFPIWIPFISFSCLSAVTNTSKTMLNKWREWASLSCS